MHALSAPGLARQYPKGFAEEWRLKGSAHPLSSSVLSVNYCNVSTRYSPGFRDAKVVELRRCIETAVARGVISEEESRAFKEALEGVEGLK